MWVQRPGKSKGPSALLGQAVTMSLSGEPPAMEAVNGPILGSSHASLTSPPCYILTLKTAHLGPEAMV